MRLGRCLVVLLAVVVMSCSSDAASAPATEATLAQTFSEAAQKRFQLWTDLVGECGKHNGLEDDAIRSYIRSIADPPAGPLDPTVPRTREQLRADLEQNGTGLVTSTRNKGQTTFRAPPGMTSTELMVMESGPIDDPRTGQSVQAGCSTWANNRLDENAVLEEAETLQQDYGAFLEEFMQSHPAIQALNEEWSLCMANKGYPELERVGDHFALIYELAAEVSSDADYERALESDIAIAVAHFDCYHDLDGPARTRSVGDEAAAAFADSIQD